MASFALLLLVVVVALTVGDSSAQSHTLKIGKPGEYDRLLYSEHVKKAGSPSGVKAAVRFPPLPSTSSQPVILTAIEAEDQLHDGSNGHAFLTSGGLRQSHATVLLEAKPRERLNFVVRFYGQ